MYDNLIFDKYITGTTILIRRLWRAFFIWSYSSRRDFVAEVDPLSAMEFDGKYDEFWKRVAWKSE